MDKKYRFVIRRAYRQPVYMLQLLSQIRMQFEGRAYDAGELHEVMKQIDSIIGSFCDAAHKKALKLEIYRKIYGSNMDIYTQTGMNRLATLYFEEIN